MTDEQIALARRAVACRGWRWMPGMLTSFNARHLGRHLWVDQGSSVVVYADQNEGEVPDLTDPATLGCLLALVREAWGDKAVIHIENNNWFYVETDGRHLWDEDNASSLLAALVAALEAAP
jgi:hypothetical protein